MTGILEKIEDFANNQWNTHIKIPLPRQYCIKINLVLINLILCSSATVLGLAGVI